MNPEQEARAADRELCKLVASGDREALSLLYERHFDGLYDMAYRTLRNGDAAADAVQDAFLKAWDSLRRSTIPDNPKAWLYAIARNAAIDEHRRRAHFATPVAEDEDAEDALAAIPATAASDPEQVALEHETADLVWGAAAALAPSEYTLLDLHVRRGLDADELSAELGLRKGAVYTRLSRMKDSLEESVGSMMLMRRGRRDCPVLNELLERMHATQLTRDVNRAVREHVKDCETCESSRKRLLSPVSMFGSLAVVPAPLWLRRRTWDRVAARLDEPRPDAVAPPPSGRRGLIAAIIAAALILGGGGVAVALLASHAPARPHDPRDVHSTSHRINEASADPTVDMAWTPRADAAGYSVSWSHAPVEEPDRVADLPGNAAGVTSSPLDPGAWYFHLRTHGRGGGWTGTVHVGPFLITSGDRPLLSVGDVKAPEGSTGSTPFTFIVRLSIPPSVTAPGTVTVNYETADGTAKAGEDYTATKGSLTFEPGRLTRTVTVPVVGDQIAEPDETFTLRLSGASGAIIGGGAATGTILDDDGAPRVFVSNASVTEGAGPAVFAVSLLGRSALPVSVGYTTEGGSAQPGSDFQQRSGTLAFDGRTTATISVPIVDDTLSEPTETLTLKLINPVNATLADSEAIGTIIDNDAAPLLSAGDAAATEGSTLTFVVRLAGGSSRAVTVGYATTDGTATAPSDYSARSGTLTFTPGETQKTVGVPAVDDSLDEPDETFRLTLSNPANASLGRGAATGRIIDNDPPPNLSIADSSLTESNAPMSFAVTLSAASGKTISVSYATADGSATHPADYAATNGVLTFAPGETQKTIQVPIYDDSLNEANETFTVSLSGPSNASLSRAQATGTIIDNDPQPTLSVNDATGVEGASITVTVTLSAASGRTVTVDYATADGSATAPTDYIAASGTLTFAPGETQKTITIQTVDDGGVEPTQFFSVKLSNATNASIMRSQAQVAIQDP